MQPCPYYLLREASRLCPLEASSPATSLHELGCLALWQGGLKAERETSEVWWCWSKRVLWSLSWGGRIGSRGREGRRESQWGRKGWCRHARSRDKELGSRQAPAKLSWRPAFPFSLLAPAPEVLPLRTVWLYSWTPALLLTLLLAGVSKSTCVSLFQVCVSLFHTEYGQIHKNPSNIHWRTTTTIIIFTV